MCHECAANVKPLEEWVELLKSAVTSVALDGKRLERDRAYNLTLVAEGLAPLARIQDAETAFAKLEHEVTMLTAAIMRKAAPPLPGVQHECPCCAFQFGEPPAAPTSDEEK